MDSDLLDAKVEGLGRVIFYLSENQGGGAQTYVVYGQGVANEGTRLVEDPDFNLVIDSENLPYRNDADEDKEEEDDSLEYDAAEAHHRLLR